MENRLVVLKLFLDELEIPTEIDTIDDRKKVQKAVYLGQLSGVDLGYRFSWYILGPYSPALTKDYYNLADSLASGDQEYKKQELYASLREKLKTILPLFEVPENVSLPYENWLELVSSYHYLRKVSRYSKEDTEKVIRVNKPHLAEFIKKAETILDKSELLS